MSVSVSGLRPWLGNCAALAGTHLIRVDIREDSLEIWVQYGCVSKDNFPSPADKRGDLPCDNILFGKRHCANYFKNMLVWGLIVLGILYSCRFISWAYVVVTRLGSCLVRRLGPKFRNQLSKIESTIMEGTLHPLGSVQRFWDKITKRFLRSGRAELSVSWAPGGFHLQTGCACQCAKSLKLSLTLYDPMDCSPLGSFVCGIFQTRILKWVAMPSSRGSSPPRGGTWVSYVSCIGSQVLYH